MVVIVVKQARNFIFLPSESCIFDLVLCSGHLYFARFFQGSFFAGDRVSVFYPVFFCFAGGGGSAERSGGPRLGRIAEASKLVNGGGVSTVLYYLADRGLLGVWR